MVRVGRVLDTLLEKFGLSKRIAAQRILLEWPKLVGDFANSTKPYRIFKERLFVMVEDSITAHILEFKKHHIIKKINKRFKGSPIKDIRITLK